MGGSTLSRLGGSALDKFAPRSNPEDKYERATFVEGISDSLLGLAYQERYKLPRTY
jgi:hypothetical protein